MRRNEGPTAPVQTFAENDYRFGTGPLRMAVEHVDWSNPVQQDGETWYEVAGVELTADGRAVRHRQALVKGRSLANLPRNRRS